jgi:hypothetical protein
MAIFRDDLAPGDCASLDQYESCVPGRLPTTKGKEREKFQYARGTLALDHGTSVIFTCHQQSLCAGNTLETKKAFE